MPSQLRLCAAVVANPKHNPRRLRCGRSIHDVYCQFFYGPDEMFGTERLYYDDVFEATASMLKLQSEHALKRRWTFK